MSLASIAHNLSAPKLTMEEVLDSEQPSSSISSTCTYTTRHTTQHSHDMCHVLRVGIDVDCGCHVEWEIREGLGEVCRAAIALPHGRQGFTGSLCICDLLSREGEG